MKTNTNCLNCNNCIEEFDELDNKYFICKIIRQINYKYGKSYDEIIDQFDLCHVNGNKKLEFYNDEELNKDDN